MGRVVGPRLERKAGPGAVGSPGGKGVKPRRDTICLIILKSFPGCSIKRWVWAASAEAGDRRPWQWAR